MPKMGDAMTQGKILTWRKRPGDSVAKGEAIAEIETDKVNVDIEAEETGTLAEIVVGEGQSAAVGAPIARIAAPGEQRTAAPAPRPAAAEERKPAAARSQVQVASEPKRQAPGQSTHVNASPLARRLASEHGIDLQSVRGTGPEGRIIREDIEALLGAGTAAASTTAPRPVAATAPPSGAAYEDLPLTRMRQTIAKRMTESKQHAPHFYVTVAVAMDDALRIRQQLNDAVGDTRKITVNDLVIKASAMTLRKFPNLNSAFLENSIRRFAHVNIAIAIALPEGLIAPVLRDCDQKTLVMIATEASALATRARSGHLHPKDYEGGTFTISNLGMFPDVESFLAIINPPHAVILAVGSAQTQAVVRNHQVSVATMMKLTMSGDHRVTDGAEVAQFLTELKRVLENPLQLVYQG
jgi:pyruvate dehydrogenase E2 component (dihydrolipoamide acetyltransferase)